MQWVCPIKISSYNIDIDIQNQSQNIMTSHEHETPKLSPAAARTSHILRTVAPPPAVWCPGSASHPVIQMTTLTTRWIADGMSLIWCWPSPYSVSMHTRPQFVVSLLELSMNLCKISQSLVESIYWHDHKEGWLTAVVPTPPAARFKSARKQDLVEDCVS